MLNTKIAGTGSYLPKKVVTNFDLEETLDTSDEWITKRVGVKQRHIVAQDETLTDMMKYASQAALNAAAIAANEIDMIVVGTVTADSVFPSAACSLQRALGIEVEIPAFDVNAACAGFLYAFNIAEQFIRTGGVKNVLVVGADAVSKLLDWKDRATCVLFGDGAGAVVLQRCERPHKVVTQLCANGQFDESLYVRNALWHNFDPCYVHMQGREVFRLATQKLGDVVDQLLQKSGLQLSDIDWLIPHQANKRIIDALAKKLQLSEEKIILTIDDHANTSSASVPLALDSAVCSGKVKRGDMLLLEAFGGGFAWGAVLIEY